MDIHKHSDPSSIFASLPEEFRQAIRRTEEEHSTSISIRETLVGGKSGAYVALVDCTGDIDGLCVLKVSRVTDDAQSEEARHRQALSSRAFSGKVAEIVAHSNAGDTYCLLVRLAGGSRLTWRPLLVTQNLLHSAYDKLHHALWASPSLKLGDEIELFDIARQTLGYRLEESHGGRIPGRLREIHHSLPASSSFAHLSARLPNPFFALRQTANLPATRIRPLRGPVHGDLHSGNVFVRPTMTAEVQDICLIDLAFFEPNGFFFYDTAYFELSSLLRCFEGLSAEQWLEVARHLLLVDSTTPKPLHPSVRGWVADLLNPRTNLLHTALQHNPQRADDLTLQHLVCQVTVGLAFLNKRAREGSGSIGLTSAQYEKSLIWSAVALSEILRLRNLSLPSTASELPIVGPDAAAAHAIDDTAWESAARFDRPGINILVLGPAARSAESASLAPLFRITWNIVLDLDPQPHPDAASLLEPQPVRSSWFGGEPPALGSIERGTAWLYINGRHDLSSCPPTATLTDWRRRYRQWMEDFLRTCREDLRPPSVRIAFYGAIFEPTYLSAISDCLDTTFGQAIEPVLIGIPQIAPGHSFERAVAASPAALLSRFATSTSAARTVQSARFERVPRRSGDSSVALTSLPSELSHRLGRDLTVVHRGLADQLPEGRTFGIDFRRGMVVEWAELASELDVPRQAYAWHRDALEKSLAASTNATHNLLHQPSAGGSTLARRLAWTLMERYPTVIVRHLTADTASHLRELFQFTSLPLLILLESTVVTESARESLLGELREDNTRAVFLWVSRLYRPLSPRDEHVLSSQLTPEESKRFLAVYSDQVTEPERRAALVRLVESPDYPDQKSPFFFGLIAFGDDYLGLNRMLDEALFALSDAEKALLADLCLVGAYTGEYFPSPEFDELCRLMNGGRRPFGPDSVIVYEQRHQLRVSHSLLARRVLALVARDPHAWKADLGLFGKKLLEHVRSLPGASSLRMRTLVEALFVTRDSHTVLRADADALVSGVPSQSRFSPLVEDIGNRSQARQILLSLVNEWPGEAHFAVHYARHLLYEQPSEIDSAIRVMEKASNIPGADRDDAVVHMVGMCYRARMQARLSDAVAQRLSFHDVAASIRPDFEMAMSLFQRAIDIDPAGEHGRVASIQTVQRLITGAMTIVGAKSLHGLLNNDSDRRWLVDALSMAEEQVCLLRERPTLSASVRSRKTVAEWDVVYGQIDAVIEKLRSLSKRYEDPGIRRALYSAILAKHGRRWKHMPQGDLRTIEDLTRLNIEARGVRDSDVRTWLMAYRHLRGFDLETALRRLADWSELRATVIEPAFYSYVFRFLQWLNSSNPRNRSYAEESTRWLGACRQQRKIGQRNWGYEWLTRPGDDFSSVHFSELEFDPVAAIRTGDEKSKRLLSGALGRMTATLVEYAGPQHAVLDAGDGLRMHVTPLNRLVKDDLGRRVSVYVSFGYDGAVGWNPELVSGGELRRATR